MNENQPESRNPSSDPGRSARPVWVAVIVVLCLAAVAVGFIIVDQHKVASQLSARNQELTASLTQTQGQLQTLGTELNAMKTAEAAREKEALEVRRATAARASYRSHHPVVKKDDPRWKQVQAELAEHQKALEAAEQQVQATRAEFQNNLSSTRDELNGSIAKTHSELVELEKKGERNYYEFDLNKGKGFQRVGPMAISLRKTNAKHQYCNVHLLVDDRELIKNHVNLYEPVLFFTDRNGQPVQIVINEITRNHMHGYVSAPKYAASAVSAANTTPQPAGSNRTGGGSGR